jgi:ABC-type nitrate/sulfonate/bicarbonate transport system substrate-binding protein
MPRLGVLIGLLLTLAACGGAAAPAQPAASGAAVPSAASRPAQMTKLRLGTPSAAAPSLIVPLTKDAGLYQKYGLEGEVQVVEGAKNLLAGMFNGELPITYQGSPEVINAALGGADVVMFAGAINTIFFSIYTRPDVTDAQQLKGKKIGYTFGGNDEAGAKLALTHLGLRVPQDISPVNMAGGQAARIAGLQNGSVDAISIAPPFTFEAKRLGLKELINVADLKVEYQSGTFATTRSYLRSNRDVVVRFTKAISEGLKFMRTNKEASIKSLADYTKTTDREVLEQSWDAFANKYYNKVPRLTKPGLQYVMDNQIPEPAVKSKKPEDFIDESVIQQLESEGFFRQLWGEDV